MAKKDELKKEILVALEKRLGKKSAMPFTLLDKKRQMVVDLLYKRIIQDGKTTNENIIKRIDEMYALVKKNTSINDEVIFDNLRKTFIHVSKESTKELIKIFNEGFFNKQSENSKEQTKELATVINESSESIVESSKKQTEEIIKASEKNTEEIIKAQPKEIEVKKPKWYKEPLDLISIKNKEFFFTKSEKQRKEDVSTMSALATAFLESLVSFFTKLAKQTFKVRLNQEHYTTPQAVIILDPKTMRSYDLKKLGMGNIAIHNQTGGSSGGESGGTDMTATNALLRHLSIKSEEQSGFQQNIQDNTAKISAVLLKKTISISSTGTLLTPTAGTKIRIFALKFSLTADLTDVSFNFDGYASFEKYLNPKAGGLYGHSISPNYFDGAVDQILQIGITGTADVQVNIDYQEVN